MSETTKEIRSRLSQDLKRQILTMDLAPGADLDEMQLCEQYGLSRTPLRETLRQLAGEGYIALQPGRGARVTELTHTTLRDFFLTAPMIYGAVMQLAAQNAQPEQIKLLKEAQVEFRKALEHGTVRERTLWNNRFHEITGEMAHNIYLLPSFCRLLVDHSRIGMTFYRPSDNGLSENLKTAANQHDAIIESIEAGDQQAAINLATEHWKLSRDNIELFVTPPSLEATLG